MANLRPDPTYETALSHPQFVRKYKHVKAMDNSWRYDGPEIELRGYVSGHWFLYVGDSLFSVSRREALEALQTKEWRRVT